MGLFPIVEINTSDEVIDTRDRQMTYRLGKWVAENVDREAMGEEVTWDVLPIASTNGDLMVYIIVSLPSGLIGEQSTLLAPLSLPQAIIIPKADVDQIIHDGFEKLRQERSDRLNGVPKED